MKRRIALLSVLGLSIVSSCSTKEKTIKVIPCNPIYAMDTTISIVFYNTTNAMEYYSHIKEIYQEVDLVASDFSSGNSVVSLYDLNVKRELTVSDTLLDLLAMGEQMYKDTNGYYNPYIGRLSDLWKKAINSSSLPKEDVIKEEVDIMNHTSITITGNTVKINGDGNIDLGGIAKGYATKRAVDYLEKNGVKNYSIDAGNSSIALGSKCGTNFTIGISKPFQNGYIGIVHGQNMMLSTSSPKYQSVMIDGNRYHHLISPYTGYPSNLYDSVTIYGVDNTLGDAYSTALFSMDLDSAKAFMENSNIQGLLYKDDEIIYKSKEFLLSEEI